MTHRAESVLDAVATVVTGLTTTGSNVARGRVWPFATYPGLSVYKGEDLASDDGETLDSVVRELVVNVVIHVQQTGNPETNLNAIAAEVYAAIAADPTLGLAYTFDADIVGDDEPEIDDAQDIPIARMVSTWRVIYEHSKSSAEA